MGLCLTYIREKAYYASCLRFREMSQWGLYSSFHIVVSLKRLPGAMRDEYLKSKKPSGQLKEVPLVKKKYK